MHFAVMGAGAVGCYYGGMLARAGQSVTFIGRPSFVETVARDGLRLETTTFDDTLRVAASADPAAIAGADVILFCVKSGATEETGAQILPHLKPGATVISLQNGVDNAERLSKVLGRPVVASAVYVASEMAGAGHCRHHGRGELAVGPHPGAEDLITVCAAAGIPVTASETIDQALWGKLILNCCYNALSAVSRRPYGEIIDVPGTRDLMAEVAGECTRVARALGVAMPDPEMGKIWGLAETMPGQFSSTAQDMMRGKPTEIDFINGHVVRVGERVGLPTPANRALHTMVKLVEGTG